MAETLKSEGDTCVDELGPVRTQDLQFITTVLLSRSFNFFVSKLNQSESNNLRAYEIM